MDELELGVDDRRLQLKNTHLRVRALPLGDRPLAALLARLPAMASFKLKARGASLVTATTRLEDYDLSLASKKDKVAVVLNKGRLRIESGAMEAKKIKKLSLRLTGMALLESASRQGDSRVVAMHSELRFEAGVLHTEDVAFATPKHRLAVKGSIDLEQNGPLSLQIASLDADGCAIYLEEIMGTLAKPEVSRAGVVIQGVITPVTAILGTVAGILAHTGCPEPFYTGDVAAPEAAADPTSPK